MDRIMVYPSAIPLETDLLNAERFAMEAIGYLAQAVLGTTTVVSGLACTPTAPASLVVNVGPGSITNLTTVDQSSFSSLTADTTDPLLKIGINLATNPFTLTAPVTTGQSINYLIEGTFQESDGTPVVLPYFNSSDPTQPFSGPSNSGTPQNTIRAQRVQLQMKAGAAANTGTQATPAVDAGWTGLWVITVNFGQTQVTSGSISVYPSSPFLAGLLASHHGGVPGQAPKINLATEVSGVLPVANGGAAPGGVQEFTSSGNFTVPTDVTTVYAEVWGGGGGSEGITISASNGICGGGGGGYSFKRITGLTPGAVIAVTVGAAGTAGSSGTGNFGGTGGSSSFGPYNSATGGAAGTLNSVGAAGSGSGGDVNLTGQPGFPYGPVVGGPGGMSSRGGGGGFAGTGAASNGTVPGGGAGGPGSGATNPGKAGAAGMVVVRW